MGEVYVREIVNLLCIIIVTVELTRHFALQGMITAEGIDGRMQKCIMQQEEGNELESGDADGDAGDVWGLPKAGGEGSQVQGEGDAAGVEAEEVK